MQWFAVCVLMTAICSGGGVTKTSGIEKFWTDDDKVFEQVYGKTSDKEIYGAALPPSISFNDPKIHATEKKERYLFNLQKESDDNDPYGFNDKYNILTKHGKKEKPATSTFNFVSYSDFKPISQSSDPETYSYLKHLEETERERNTGNVISTGGFKPYLNYNDPNPEETEAYKSIQEILDAHEANKGKEEDDDGNSMYLTYREKNNKKILKKKPARNANTSKPRCLSGRCRKRSTSSSYRLRPRPYYRRIKHRIY